MKKVLFVLAVLSLNLSAYSSSSSSNDKTKKTVCGITALFLPAALLGGPATFSSAVSMWAQACLSHKGDGKNMAPVYTKKW